MSRRQGRRPLRNDARNELQRDWPIMRSPMEMSSRELEPIYQRRMPLDNDFYEESSPYPPSSMSYDRGYQPYSLNERIAYRDKRCSSPNNIPTQVFAEQRAEPKPLFPRETVEQLRAKLGLHSNVSEYSEENDCDNSGGPYDPPSSKEEIVDTKHKIEEIIFVANALRERLEEEEELMKLGSRQPNIEQEEYYDDRDEARMRQELEEDMYESSNSQLVERFPRRGMSSENIPRLMDLKPKLPSLMDVPIAPPPVVEVIKENLIVALNSGMSSKDTCWNCDSLGHKFSKCPLPKSRNFCFRCGKPGFDITSCSYCNIYNINRK